MPEPDGNPYVGPRPFERSERPVFFGRDREVRELLSLVVAHRVVLLYATSGAGKTSLLNAGLLPLLEEEEGFDVLPPARVAGADVPPEVANPFVHNVVAGWRRDPAGMEAADGEATLVAFLRGRDHPRDADGLAAPRLVVFDQFEELFTFHQQHWRQRDPFVIQLAEALEDDPLLRVVLAIREDYLAQVDRHAKRLPGALRTRLRLERLVAEAALTAVTRPVEGTRRRYAPGVAEQLVADLLEMRVDTGRGEVLTVEGEFAEPVQLQVVCHSLWASLPPDVEEITDDHLQLFGDVDEVLARFYGDAIAAAAAAAGTPGKESDLRKALERTFVTPMGTRGTVYAGATETGGIPNAAIEELERRHLLRGEFRAGTRWLELTHDRLIEPIRASNRERAAAAQARRVRRLTRAAIVLAVALALAVGLGVWLWSGGSKTTETPAERAELDEGIGAIIGTFEADRPLLAAAFDGNGLRTVDDDGNEHVWRQAQEVATNSLRSRVDAAVFSPDGNFLATTNGSSEATLFRRGRFVRMIAGAGAGDVIAVAFDGRPTRIATVSADGTARVEDIGSGETVCTVRQPWIRTAALSADSTVLALAGEDGTVVVVRAGPGCSRDAQKRPLQAATNETQTSVALSADGELVASGASDGTVSLWEASGVRDLLAGHRGAVRSIAFNPEGSLLVTGSDDGTARLWAAGPGAALAILPAYHPVRSASFGGTPLILTADKDGTATMWQTRRQKILEAADALLRHRGEVRYAHAIELDKALRAIRDRVRLPDLPKYLSWPSLIKWLYWQAGAPDPEGTQFRGGGYFPRMAQRGRRVQVPRPGDIVFWDFTGDHLPDAGAVYLGNGKVIRWLETADSQRLVVSPLIDAPSFARTYLP